MKTATSQKLEIQVKLMWRSGPGHFKEHAAGSASRCHKVWTWGLGIVNWDRRGGGLAPTCVQGVLHTSSENEYNRSLYRVLSPGTVDGIYCRISSKYSSRVTATKQYLYFFSRLMRDARADESRRGIKCTWPYCYKSQNYIRQTLGHISKFSHSKESQNCNT